MKSFTKFLAALLIALVCLFSAALADVSVTTTGKVNLRANAGLRYRSLGTVAKGVTLTYDATAMDERGVTWLHVTYNGRSGWISSVYAKETGSAAVGQVTTTGSVNLRSGIGLSFASLRIIKGGVTLSYDMTGKDGRGVTWYHVTYRGKNGWVSSACVTEGGNSTSPTTVTATGAVNIRSGASKTYQSLGVIAKGKVATYLGEARKDSRGVTWYKVSYNGITGWVSSKYARLN